MASLMFREKNLLEEFLEMRGGYVLLPRDGIPITQWPDIDQASLDVARGIMDSILESPG